MKKQKKSKRKCKERVPPILPPAPQNYLVSEASDKPRRKTKEDIKLDAS